MGMSFLILTGSYYFLHNILKIVFLGTITPTTTMTTTLTTLETLQILRRREQQGGAININHYFYLNKELNDIVFV